MNAKMEKSTFLYTAKTYILPDLSRRFRPFWALHRSAEVKAFGRNFTLWAVYTGLMCIATSILLYLFAVNSGIGKWLSLLFVFLALTGPASVIWYQYAHSENLGMFFLSLSLFFLAKAVYPAINSSFFKILFAVSLILTMLCKESFLLAVPAVLFLYIWLWSAHRNAGLYESFKKNKAVLLIPFTFSVMLTAAVLIYIGSDKPLYAGVDSGIISAGFITGILNALSEINLFWLMIAGFVIIFVIQQFISGNDDRKESSEQQEFNFINPVIFFILIFISQYALYYKSGFHTRYYLPLISGFAFIIIYTTDCILKNKTVPNFTKYGYILFIVILIIFNTVIYTLPDIVEFNKDRKATTNLLNSNLERQKENSETLIVMDPVHHWGFGKSFYLYMTNSGGKGKMNFTFIKLDTMIYPYTDSVLYNITEVYTKKYFTGQIYDSAAGYKNFDLINIFPGLEERFISENSGWFRRENYSRKDFGEYMLFTRK